MSTTPKIAFAVLAGCALGRTRKMKLAITLAGLGVGRRINADPKQLLEQGAEFFDSPELAKLGGDLQGRLYDAAKAATSTAAANRVDSLSRKLDERAGKLRRSDETDRSAGAMDSPESAPHEADPERASAEEPGQATPESAAPATRGEAQQRSPATSSGRADSAAESEPTRVPAGGQR